MMASQGKRKGKSAGESGVRRTLERLKPDEAALVLRRLLEVHPDLASEAEEAARSLLEEVK